MAHKKAGGSTQNNRDSQGQRLGVKITGGDVAHAGAIIVRQRGSHIRPGKNVMKGKDDTLFATAAGMVHFYTRKRNNFDGHRAKARFVEVVEKKA